MSTRKKYELIDETYCPNDVETLYRIRALVDIPRHNIRVGDLGGFIESEKNLSHKGSCWVGGNAHVVGESEVKDDALVTDNASVRNGIISKRAQIRERAFVMDAHVSGNACVYGKAAICSFMPHIFITEVTDDSQVYGEDTKVFDSKVTDRAKVYGCATVSGGAHIRDNSEVFDHANVNGSVISGQSKIFGEAIVTGRTDFVNASISSDNDILTFADAVVLDRFDKLSVIYYLDITNDLKVVTSPRTKVWAPAKFDRACGIHSLTTIEMRCMAEKKIINLGGTRAKRIKIKPSKDTSAKAASK